MLQPKPSATSAATTAFCAEKISAPGGHLWVDGNGKITAANGTLDKPRPNAFSLVQIEDCPGSTPTCRTSCYVHGLQTAAPDTHALYQHNSEMIRKILAYDDKGIWSATMARWIEENAAGGFRWHVSGDVFSFEYAEWIADVCALAPAVPFWIYTRSFDFLQPLLEVSTVRGGNLAVNLSCDADNLAEGLEVSAETGLRVCYLTADGKVPPTMAHGDVIFPDYALRGGTERGQQWFADLPSDYKAMVCPVDYHGKAENRRCGPCPRCLT